MSLDELKMEDAEISEVSGGTSYVGACFAYIVKRGEKLSDIAQRYHSTVRELCEVNSLQSPESIREGQKLLIPAK